MSIASSISANIAFFTHKWKGLPYVFYLLFLACFLAVRSVSDLFLLGWLEINTV